MHRISFLIVVEARRPIKKLAPWHGRRLTLAAHHYSTANDPAYYGIDVFRFAIIVFRLIKDVGVSVAEWYASLVVASSFMYTIGVLDQRQENEKRGSRS